MLARTMIEGGIENRGIRKLHRNLRVPSAACYSYTIPRNRHFRNWTSIMSFATRTSCISGGHTIPVWELPIVQDWHKSRFIVGNLYTQRPFTRPLRASNQLGWVLYKRTIRLRPARTSSWLPNSPGQAPRDIPRLFNSWALFLYPIYLSSLSGRFYFGYAPSYQHDSHGLLIVKLVSHIQHWGLSVLNSFHDVRPPLEH